MEDGYCGVGRCAGDGGACEVEVFAELREYCLANLARFKVPRLWFAVDEFPITASGKIQKFALRTMIATGEITPVLDADKVRSGDG